MATSPTTPKKRPPVSGLSPLNMPQAICADCGSRMRVEVDGVVGAKPRGFKLFCDLCERACYTNGDHINVMPQKYEALPPAPAAPYFGEPGFRKPYVPGCACHEAKVPLNTFGEPRELAPAPPASYNVVVPTITTPTAEETAKCDYIALADDTATPEVEP